jgi:hypothetical protein
VKALLSVAVVLLENHMRNVTMLRMEPNFVSIPVEQAIYCENCETVSNSTRGRCGVCGSESIFHLAMLLDGPPSGPDSGPSPAGCIVPILCYDQGRAA